MRHEGQHVDCCGVADQHCRKWVHGTCPGSLKAPDSAAAQGGSLGKSQVRKKVDVRVWRVRKSRNADLVQTGIVCERGVRVRVRCCVKKAHHCLDWSRRQGRDGKLGSGKGFDCSQDGEMRYESSGVHTRWSMRLPMWVSLWIFVSRVLKGGGDCCERVQDCCVQKVATMKIVGLWARGQRDCVVMRRARCRKRRPVARHRVCCKW